jgi:chromosome segregation ATPase
MNVPIARAAAEAQRERWENELRELEGRIGELMESKTPIRHELKRLGKRKQELLRKLGMI